MRRIRFFSTGALLLLLGSIAPAYAQEHGQDKDQGKSRPEQQHQQAQPSQQDKAQPGTVFSLRRDVHR